MDRLRYVRNKGLRCLNCPAPAYSKQRCEPCYRWWKRSGETEERPIAALVAHEVRIFTAEQRHG